MAVEKIRGCGYRKVGGVYLCGSGIALPCDMLPLELTACSTCGFEVPFTRGFMWISKKYVEYHNNLMWAPHRCKCASSCPICYPAFNDLERYGLMWCGQRYYTSSSFIAEAKEVGVSKKIGQIPKDLVLGKTWVLLAHKKVPFQKPFESLGDKEASEVFGLRSEPVYKPAIFYAFVPTRIEKLVWKSQLEKEREKPENEGLTLIPIPDGDADHKP